MRFKEDEDTLPLFSKVYTELKKRGIKFADESTVKVWDQVPNAARPETEVEQEGVIRFRKPLDEKHARVKAQLDIVLSNIILANEMIDGQDPRDDVRENEALSDVVVSIKNMEPKLENLILKLKHEDLVNYLLHINDDLKSTLFRYSRLKSGTRPAKFVKTCIMEGEKIAKPSHSESPQK